MLHKLSSPALHALSSFLRVSGVALQIAFVLHLIRLDRKHSFLLAYWHIAVFESLVHEVYTIGELDPSKWTHSGICETEHE